MKNILFLTITLMAISVMVAMASEHGLIRNKRGLSDFFKRFWNIRKKLNYFPFQQSSASVYPGQDFLTSPSSFFPLYQMTSNGPHTYAPPPPPGAFHPGPPQSPQPSYAVYEGNQIGDSGPVTGSGQGQYQSPINNQQQSSSFYYPSAPIQGSQQMNNGQQQYGGTMSSSANLQYYSNYIQGDESMQKPNYYYPQQIGTSPYTFHSNPSQANTFNSKPYGSNPGTIDVHQVLDQFIRSAGLSPHGDHDNVNRDRAYSEDNKALSVKKLYSYPFYFSSSGDRPSRRQSNDETAYSIGGSSSSSSPQTSSSTSQSSMIKDISQLSAPSRMESITQQSSPSSPITISNQIKPSSSSSIISDVDLEKSFIAKNAAALQDFLANKMVTNEINQ